MLLDWQRHWQSGCVVSALYHEGTFCNLTNSLWPLNLISGFFYCWDSLTYVSVWYVDTRYIEYIVMMSIGWVTLGCQNFISWNTDFDEPIVGFILPLSIYSVPWWLGRCGSVMSHLWGTWPGRNGTCLVGKACLGVNYYQWCSGGCLSGDKSQCV